MMLSFRDFVRQFGLLYFVVAASYVAIILAYSFHFGRLAGVPQYDDVGYFMDAIRRYHILMRSGLENFVVNFFYTNPPLSPVISGMAVLSYVLFGIQDWAPYIMNGLFVWLLLLLMAWYFQKDNTIKNLMIMFMLTCPLSAWGVHDFRPDIWNALFTTLACFIITKAIIDDRQEGRSQYVLAGLMLGGALLIKPSACLFTIAIYVSAILFSIVLQSYLRKEWCFSALRKTMYSVLVTVIVILPYYAFSWHMIYNYVYAALITNKAIWAVAGDAWFQMTFYLTGNGGAVMLGKHFWLALFFLVPLIWLLRVDKKALAYISVLFMLTILTWFVVSINEVKTHFLGASFYWFLLLTFAVTVHYASAILHGQALKRGLFVGVLGLIVAFSLITYKQNKNWWIDTPVNVEQRNNIISKITRDLQQLYIIKKDRLDVFMPYIGYMTIHNLMYLLVKKGQENIYITSYWLNYNENISEIYNKKFSASDVVILASENKQSIMTASQGVAGKNMKEVNDLLFGRDDFSLYQSYVAPSGQKIFIYVKKYILKNIGS